MTEILYKELSFQIVGAAYEVHRVLGPGFLEGLYERPLAHELAASRIPFRRQVRLVVLYKSICLGKYRADFVIDDAIIIEVKSISALTAAHEAQAIHYLAATGYRLAMLLNFGATSLQIKRIIRQRVRVIREIRGDFC
jgi:GxxExxY protein